MENKKIVEWLSKIPEEDPCPEALSALGEAKRINDGTLMSLEETQSILDHKGNCKRSPE